MHIRTYSSEYKDSLLKDSTEHLINEINKYQDKINGYVDDNYELVGEEK